jgi:AraC-like DNA-binding protein
LAADAGFADQAHCSRVIKAELGTTPAALRAALA